MSFLMEAIALNKGDVLTISYPRKKCILEEIRTDNSVLSQLGIEAILELSLSGEVDGSWFCCVDGTPIAGAAQGYVVGKVASILRQFGPRHPVRMIHG